MPGGGCSGPARPVLGHSVPGTLRPGRMLRTGGMLRSRAAPAREDVPDRDAPAREDAPARDSPCRRGGRPVPAAALRGGTEA